MNKKYVLAGFLFWATVSGYMGIRILDSYTEDAVSAALTCIPATAREIKFSFFSKHLVLEGLQYEIPDEKVQRKGTIERIEVKGFNRKILFVMPKMPEYDPEHLPVVAESITATGITESRHENYARTEVGLDSLEIIGWRQRLGILLDRYARGGTDERFFEELFRCGMDRAQVTGLQIRQEDSRYTKTVHVRLGKVLLPDGITPPQRGEHFHPLRVFLEKPSYEDAGWHFSSGRLELLDLTPPSPPSLGKMNGFGLEKLLAAYAASEGHQPFRPAFSKLYVDAGRLQAKNRGQAASLTGLSLSVDPAGAGTKIDMAVSEFHVPNDVLPQHAGSFDRHAPSGITGKLRVMGNLTGNRCVSSLEASLQGLGKLNVTASFSGDMDALFACALSQDRQPLFFKRLAEVRIERAKMIYEDSGLCALALDIAAKKEGMEPLGVLDALDAQAAMELENNAVSGVVWDAASILREQLRAPGKVIAELAKGKSPTFAQLAFTALMQPAKLPIVISSAPGKKPMRSYFQ